MPKMNGDNRDSETENPHDRGRSGGWDCMLQLPIAVRRSMASSRVQYQIRTVHWRRTRLRGQFD
jgi:hypothetical protein